MDYDVEVVVFFDVVYFYEIGGVFFFEEGLGGVRFVIEFGDFLLGVVWIGDVFDVVEGFVYDFVFFG